MITVGEFSFLNCNEGSFSPKEAILISRGGKTISELAKEHYKKTKETERDIDRFYKKITHYYSSLWDEYFAENGLLVYVLLEYKGVEGELDVFGELDPVGELVRVMNKFRRMYEDGFKIRNSALLGVQ
jgi:hypothetical protein